MSFISEIQALGFIILGLNYPYKYPVTSPSLDIYKPSIGTNHPIILVVHGGGWFGGDRYDGAGPIHLAQIKSFLGAGYAVANVSYTLGQSPAGIHDIKCAIRWVRRNYAGLSINPNRIGIWGASAGGHLAMLAAVTGDSYLNGNPCYPGDLTQTNINAAAASSAPFDLKTLDADTLEKNYPLYNTNGWLYPGTVLSQLIGADASLLSSVALMDEISPSYYLPYASPIPVMIQAGTLDATIPEIQSMKFFFNALNYNFPIEYSGVPGGHNDPVFITYSINQVTYFFQRKL